MSVPRPSKSIYGNLFAVIFLLGLVPCLLLLFYGFFFGMVFDGVLLIVVLACFGFVFAGSYLLASKTWRWALLAKHAASMASGQQNEHIRVYGDSAQDAIAESINILNERINQAKRDHADMTAKLLVYANDVEQYQKKIHAEEKLRSLLSRYVGRSVVDLLMKNHGEIPLRNEQKELTILFADVRSFTSLSESMPPEEVVAMLNEFFGAMAEVIFRHNGVLDKFVGDQLMAQFGTLAPTDNSACDAVTAAVEMQQEVNKMMEVRRKEGKPTFSIGIGINTGDVIVGNVGADVHMDYTAIGDTVNVASRLEKMAKGGQIIIGENTYRYCEDEFNLRKTEAIRVRNRKGMLALYEVMCDRQAKN